MNKPSSSKAKLLITAHFIDIKSILLLLLLLLSSLEVIMTVVIVVPIYRNSTDTVPISVMTGHLLVTLKYSLQTALLQNLTATGTNTISAAIIKSRILATIVYFFF
jgi:hypothetical protein